MDEISGWPQKIGHLQKGPWHAMVEKLRPLKLPWRVFEVNQLDGQWIFFSLVGGFKHFFHNGIILHIDFHIFQDAENHQPGTMEFYVSIYWEESSQLTFFSER